jgi:hypothetical protein
VNVEAEIDDLKLRVEALEAKLRPGRTGIATVIDIVEMKGEVKAEIADVLTEISQGLAALSIEIASLRRYPGDQVTGDQFTLLNKLDSIHCELIALGLRFDQPLDKNDA